MRLPLRLKPLLWGLLLGLGALIGACGWLLGTETGRLWLAGRALDLAGGAGVEVTVERMASPSLGLWRVQRLKVVTGTGLRLEVNDLELLWHPRALFAKHLKIKNLSAIRVDYYHPISSSPDSSGGELPQSPVRISLDRLAIESLGVHELGRALPDYRVQAGAELFGPDHPLQFQLELHSLDSEQTQVRVQTQAEASGEAHIQGSVTEAPGGLLGSLARWPAQNPLEARFRLSLTRDEQRLHLALEELSAQALGHKLQAAGTLDYQWQDRSLRLHELELLVDGKRQRLRGGYSAVDLWAELNLTELPLDLVTPWYADISGGSASGRLDLNWLHGEPGRWPNASGELQGDVNYAQKRLVLDLKGALKDRQLSLEPSFLKYGGAEVRTQGQLDFAGAASDLTGTLQHFHTDLLTPWRIPVPEGLTAATDEARIHLRGALRQPEVSVKSHVRGIYKQQPFELTLDGEADRRRAKLRSLHLVADTSQLGARGTVDWSGGPNDLQLEFKDFKGELLGLAPAQVSEHLPEGLSLLANGAAKLTGPLRAPAIQTDSLITGAYQLRGEALPYRLALKGALTTGRSDRLKLSAEQVELFLFDHPTLSLSGDYSAKAMNLHLRLSQLPTRALAALGWRGIEGQAEADLQLTGTLVLPELTGHLEYSDSLPGRSGAVPLTLRTEVSTGQGRVLLDARLRHDQESLGQMQVSLPQQLYLQTHTGPLPLDAHAQGEWDLRALRLFMDLGVHRLDGRTRLDLTFSGDLHQPVVRGQLQLLEGTYHNRATGTLLEAIHLALEGDGEQLLIREGRARSGEGELQLGGTVFWQPERRLLSDAVNLTLDVRRASLLQRRDLQSEVAGRLEVKGSFAELRVQGDLEVAPLNASVDSAIRTRIPQIEVTEIEAAAKPRENAWQPPVVHLDLRLRANQQAYLRGRGLETELAGGLTLTGTLDKPQYRGLFTTRRGRLELFGKRFVLEEGEVRFNNSGVIMRIPAVHKTQEIEIRAELHGTAEEPKLTLSSIPALPNDEILSRLIFGKSAQDISAFEAIRLATAVRSLTSGGGFDPVDSARSLLGVDSLTIDSETGATGDSTYRVGVGKYINERVYVELGRSSNPTQPWSGVVEVELSPRVILESHTNQSGGAGTMLLWKRDY